MEKTVRRGTIDRVDQGITVAVFDDGNVETRRLTGFSDGDRFYERDGEWISDPRDTEIRKKEVRERKARVIGNTSLHED